MLYANDCHASISRDYIAVEMINIRFILINIKYCHLIAIDSLLTLPIKNLIYSLLICYSLSFIKKKHTRNLEYSIHIIELILNFQLLFDDLPQCQSLT